MLARAGEARRGPSRLVPIAPGAATDDRVAFAARTRRDVRALTDGEGVVLVGRGLCGRLEVSIEIEPARRAGETAARRLSAALADVGPGATLWAQISAGNAAALRAALHGGFRPIGAKHLIR